MKILVTGAAGFIGMSTALRLLARGDEVVGIDNLNDYYEVSLKKARLAQLLPPQ
jgi:UDP-glucuronate 4-epimerase